MFSPAVCMNLKICSFLCFLLIISYRHVCGTEYVSYDDKVSMGLLVKTGRDIIKSTFSILDGVESLRQKHINKPSFEIGYLTFTIFEKYRKMIDKYNTTMFMGKQLWSMEILMYLEEIENLYWEVEHLTNMLHEIQRKYGVLTPLGTKYREQTSEELKAIQAKQKVAKLYKQTLDMVTTKKLRIQKQVLDRLYPTTTPTTKGMYPIDYGWRI